MPYKDPDKQREAKRLWIQRRRAGPPGPPPAVPPYRIKDASDLLRLLEEQAAQLRVAEGIGPVERARAIGYLTSVAGKLIETHNVEKELADLRRELGQAG